MEYDRIPNTAVTELSQIGYGAFGEVYKAKLSVAVKFLYTDSSSKLLDEIEMMRRCKSPYIVQVLGVCEGNQPNQLGMVMEYMERGPLSSVLKTINGPPPWALVVKVAAHVSQGLKFIHNLSPRVLHLDLKPENVLLDKHLNAKLTDFGLSREYYSRSSSMKSCDNVGTLFYMPPEALSGNDEHLVKPSTATDIYSFGIFLWSLVTGQRPYDGVIMPTFKFRIRDGDRPSMEGIDVLKDVRPDLDSLTALMKLCWHEEISVRPSADVCADKTRELYERDKNNNNTAAIPELLEKLDLDDKQKKVDRSLRTSAPPANLRVRTGSPGQDTQDGRKTNSKAQPTTSNNRTHHRSSPEYPPAPTYTISHLIGGQIGDHNHMSITLDPNQHPSMSSTVNPPPPRDGNRKNQQRKQL